MFSTARNTQRDSQSWAEKRRGREEIEVNWGRKRIVKKGKSKGGIQKRERDLGSTLFPKCFPQPGTHTEIHRVG